MKAALPTYEIYAIRYARRDARRTDHFIGGDPHDAPMPMDYFTWAVVGTDKVFIVDTGFTEPVARKRKREFLRCPIEALNLLEIDPAKVEDVIITHLHYDHVGNFHKFPKARFHLQEKEMHFATGHYVRYPKIRHSFEVEDITGMVKLNFEERLELHLGDVTVAPGLTLHHTGGHTAGLQFARVHTRRGWVVLASDVSHYYENMLKRRPFATAFHIGDMLDAYGTLHRLAETPDHIIPGHDPLVMRQYKAPRPDLEGIIVRLDLDPVSIPEIEEMR